MDSATNQFFDLAAAKASRNIPEQECSLSRAAYAAAATAQKRPRPLNRAKGATASGCFGSVQEPDEGYSNNLETQHCYVDTILEAENDPISSQAPSDVNADRTAPVRTATPSFLCEAMTPRTADNHLARALGLQTAEIDKPQNFEVNGTFGRIPTGAQINNSHLAQVHAQDTSKGETVCRSSALSNELNQNGCQNAPPPKLDLANDMRVQRQDDNNVAEAQNCETRSNYDDKKMISTKYDIPRNEPIEFERGQCLERQAADNPSQISGDKSQKKSATVSEQYDKKRLRCDSDSSDVFNVADSREVHVKNNLDTFIDGLRLRKRKPNLSIDLVTPKIGGATVAENELTRHTPNPDEKSCGQHQGWNPWTNRPCHSPNHVENWQFSTNERNGLIDQGDDFSGGDDVLTPRAFMGTNVDILSSPTNSDFPTFASENLGCHFTGLDESTNGDLINKQCTSRDDVKRGS